MLVCLYHLRGQPRLLIACCLNSNTERISTYASDASSTTYQIHIRQPLENSVAYLGRLLSSFRSRFARMLGPYDGYHVY